MVKPNLTNPLLVRIAAAPASWPKARLEALVKDSGGDPDAFVKLAADWFEEEMKRLSGWYKRRTQFFLLLYGALLAVALNVDSVVVTRTLWNDPTVRATVVAQAEAATATSTTPPTTAPGTSAAPSTMPADQASPTTTPSCPPGPGSGHAATTTASDPLDCLANRVQTLRSLRLPIGWPSWPWAWRIAYRGDDPRFPHASDEIVLKVLGLVFTALAAAQGGPFWFDLLGKLIPLRATGPK
jgi:hypothetical protein